MDWENKVIWQEGLFLQPQHLQQQERYFERLVRTSTAGLTPFSYGLTQLEINTDLLALGKFTVRSAVGIMPDGTPFNMPRDIDCPAPIDLPETLRNATIYLILPDRQPGAIEAAPADLLETAARFFVAEHEAIDTNAGYQSVASVPIGKLRMRLAHEHESRAGYTALGLGRIIEVRPDRSVVTDEAYIPPVLFFGVSPMLAGFGSQLQGLLHHRAEELSGRVSETAMRGAPTARGAADIADYLVLQICNHYELVISHMTASAGQLHPEAFYRVLLGLAGELATFSDGRKRPPVFPPYRHDDLSATFRPIIASLRQYLSAVLERSAIPNSIAGNQVGHSRWRNHRQRDRDGLHLGHGRLGAGAAGHIAPQFPNQCKIGPVEKIRDLITVALPGIAVSALPVVPRQLPYYAGRSYFELDRTGPSWAALANSAAIAIHVTGQIPGLEIELWAIRG